MATYMTHETVIGGGENGENLSAERTLSDAEIIAGAIQFRVSLSADKSIIAGDGVEVVNITVQLVSAPLENDTQTNIAQAVIVLVSIDGNNLELTTDANGNEVIELTSVANGHTITISAINYPSNSIDIEVT